MKEERKIEVRFTPINGNIPIEVWEKIREMMEQLNQENWFTEWGMTMH